MIQNGVFQADFKLNLYYFSSLGQEIGLLPVMLHSLFVQKVDSNFHGFFITAI
jgi:hypothetical protein